MGQRGGTIGPEDEAEVEVELLGSSIDPVLSIPGSSSSATGKGPRRTKPQQSLAEVLEVAVAVACTNRPSGARAVARPEFNGTHKNGSPPSVAL